MGGVPSEAKYLEASHPAFFKRLVDDLRLDHEVCIDAFRLRERLVRFLVVDFDDAVFLCVDHRISERFVTRTQLVELMRHTVGCAVATGVRWKAGVWKKENVAPSRHCD